MAACLKDDSVPGAEGMIHPQLGNDSLQLSAPA